VDDERRCPSCGALVAADAAWCGQCFTRLDAPAPSATEPVGATTRLPAATAVELPSGGRIEVEPGGRPSWTCSICAANNAIEAPVCAVCGAPFGRLFAEPARRPQVPPQTAAIWSLVWPGLGHWKTGYRADAVARFVLFTWTFGTLLILLVSRFGKGGLGATFPLFVLFLVAAAAVYGVSAIDAYRLAGGEEPLITSRALLWASAVLVVVSVALASFITLPAARR
jgi:hypothetical protein